MSIDVSVRVIAGIEVEVVRKRIKNMHLAVYPPDGRVRLAAPMHVNDEAIRLAIVTRLGWIRRQQRAYITQERQTEREYVSGESCYHLGRRYRLRVHQRPGAPRVELRTRTYLDLYVAPGTDTARRQRVVEEWQRARLKELLPDLVTLWSAKLGVAAPTWGVKKMKTKWGSCSTRSQRIWLNLELVKKPAHCLEYVLAHEIAHLLVRDHGERFAALMDRVMPSWQRVRDELNHLPLAPANW